VTAATDRRRFAAHLLRVSAPGIGRWAAYLLALRPGLMSHDSVDQFRQATSLILVDTIPSARQCMHPAWRSAPGGTDVTAPRADLKGVRVVQP
jgi:hypothetical protein